MHSRGRYPAGCGGTVVLMHGLGRGPQSLERLEYALSAAGYVVVNRAYPSRAHRLPDLVDAARQRLRVVAAEAPPPLHGVGHSLGGLVLRGAFAGLGTDAEPGRLVMIGSPCRGLRLLDDLGRRGWLGRGGRLGRRGWLPALFGEPLRDLVRDSPALVALGTPAMPTGVIAGTWRFTPVSPAGIANLLAYPRTPGDGTVELGSTVFAGLTERALVAAGHTFLPDRAEVVALTLRFLATGRFARAGSAPDAGAPKPSAPA